MNYPTFSNYKGSKGSLYCNPTLQKCDVESQSRMFDLKSFEISHFPHCNALSESTKYIKKMQLNAKSIVERRLISQITEYSKTSSIYSSNIYLGAFLRKPRRLSSESLKSQMYRTIQWQNEQYKKLCDRRDKVRKSIFEIKLKKRELSKLITEKKRSSVSPPSKCNCKQNLQNLRKIHTEGVALCYARAQSLRKKLTNGILFARQHAYEERVRQANVIRKESQLIRHLIMEMKEREIKWRQGLRRRVLLYRQFSTFRSKYDSERWQSSDENTLIVEDTRLNELHQELKNASQQEICLNDELLELKELLGCLTRKIRKR